MASQQAASTVLIIEDEFAIRETLVEFLEEEGYQVAGVGNGREALDYLRTAPPPALIFLDLRMPVMSGVQFLEEQQRDPTLAGLPVVLLSADRSGQQQVATERVADILDKPVRLVHLLEVVERYCKPQTSRSA